MEHLLRDIRDIAVGSLSARINAQLQSLQGLHHRLHDIGQYLQKVLDGALPINHSILGNLQDVFNLLPNLSTPGSASEDGDGKFGENNELARAMSVKTNDQLMAIYLSSLIRAIIAFHDLIDNKIQNRQNPENDKEKGEEEKKKEGEKGTEKDKDGKEKEKDEANEKSKDGKSNTKP